MVLFHPIYKGPIWHELNNDRLGTPCGVLCCAWGEDPAVSFHIASMLWGSGLKRESKSRFWAHSFFLWLGHNNEGIEGCSKKWVKFWKFWKFAGSRGLLFIQVVQIFYGFQWILFPPYESFLSWKTRCFNRLTTSLTSWKITPTSSSTGGLGFCCASCFSGPLPNGKVTTSCVCVSFLKIWIEDDRELRQLEWALFSRPLSCLPEKVGGVDMTQ